MMALTVMDRKKMKFIDIPQFTDAGHYRTDVSFDDVPRFIARWEKEHSLEINPDFQRGHVWQTDQKIAFVEYALAGGRVQDFLFNHPAWMNFRKGRGHLVLVDGLQRLTAITDFLENKIPAYGHCFCDYTDKLPYSRYSFSFRVNALKTRKEVLNWYIEINSGGTPHTVAELNKVRNLLVEEEK